MTSDVLPGSSVVEGLHYFSYLSPDIVDYFDLAIVVEIQFSGHSAVVKVVVCLHVLESDMKVL